MMNTNMQKMTAVGLAVVMLFSTVIVRPLYAANTFDSNANDYQSRLRQLIDSGDVRHDEYANSGVAVALLDNPEDYEAGAAESFVFVVVISAYKTYQAYMIKLEIADKFLKSGNYILEEGTWEAETAINVGQIIAFGDLPPEEDNASFMKKLGESLKSTFTPKNPISETQGVLQEAKKFFNNVLAKIDGVGSVEIPVADQYNGTDLVQGGSLSSANDVYSWQDRQGAIAGLSGFGPIGVPENSAGSRFGLIHTGYGNASAEGRLMQTFMSPANAAATFTARYNFVTTEFPQFLGSQYNDSFFIHLVHLQSGQSIELARFDGSLNQLFSESDINTSKHVQFSGGLPTQILDMASSGAGQTGWITVSLGGINLKQGHQYQVRLRVNDVGDAIYDSALLVDRVSLR